MLKKDVICKMYLKELKDGIKGQTSSYDKGWTAALKMVLGVTNSEEQKIIKGLLGKNKR